MFHLLEIKYSKTAFVIYVGKILERKIKTREDYNGRVFDCICGFIRQRKRDLNKCALSCCETSCTTIFGSEALHLPLYYIYIFHELSSPWYLVAETKQKKTTGKDSMVCLEQWLFLDFTWNFPAVLRGMNWFTGSQGTAVVYWGISVTSCSVSVGKVFINADSLLFCMNS